MSLLHGAIITLSSIVSILYLLGLLLKHKGYPLGTIFIESAKSDAIVTCFAILISLITQIIIKFVN